MTNACRTSRLWGSALLASSFALLLMMWPRTRVVRHWYE
jgi:hypothetical protein